jgi:hypothetical protein
MRLALLIFAAALLGSRANAVPIVYDISVNGADWYGGLSWGIPGLPIIGTISVDNELGLVDSFSLTAGPTHWSLANFGTTPAISFNGNGNLIGFNLYKSYSGNYQMSLRSDNHFELFDGNNVASCNSCVNFSPETSFPVPEPAVFALFSAGIVVLIRHLTRLKRFTPV